MNPNGQPCGWELWKRKKNTRKFPAAINQIVGPIAREIF